MSTPKHTPTPWMVAAKTGEAATYIIEDKPDEAATIACTNSAHGSAAKCIANAALIVKRVNAFEPLVEALRELESMRFDLVDVLKQAEAYGIPNAYSIREWVHGELYEKSRAALALADKEEA